MLVFFSRNVGLKQLKQERWCYESRIWKRKHWHTRLKTRNFHIRLKSWGINLHPLDLNWEQIQEFQQNWSCVYSGSIGSIYSIDWRCCVCVSKGWKRSNLWSSCIVLKWTSHEHWQRQRLKMKHADSKLRTLLIRWSSFSLSPSSWLISSASILRIWGFLPSHKLIFWLFQLSTYVSLPSPLLLPFPVPLYLCLVLSCIPPLSFFGYFLVKYFVP